MKTQWILIANASTARLYGRAAPDRPLEILAEHNHPESRLKGSELGSDRPGHEATDHSSSGSRFEPRTDTRRKQHQQFADELAERLAQGLAEGRYASLWLFASNPFLGELKSRLSPRVAQHVRLAHASDFTALPLDELEQRLRDPRLFEA